MEEETEEEEALRQLSHRSVFTISTADKLNCLFDAQ